jgi:peroxiredoxin Q/BCP
MKKATTKKKSSTKKTTTPKKKITKSVQKKTASSSTKKVIKKTVKKTIKTAAKKAAKKAVKSTATKTIQKAKPKAAKAPKKTSKVTVKTSESASFPQPQVGQAAPDVKATLSSGDSFRLSDVKGRKHVVLYFYPKDDTPGCTKESCAFELKRQAFEAHDVMILGVSPDDTRSHQKFKTKYGLNFELIADVDHSVSQSYGAWALKSMYGKTYWGVQRSTFLIDKHGIIRNVWPKVSVDGHDEEVEQAIREL